MDDKISEECFISPYLERPLRSIEEVLRGLPKERRAHLMNVIEGLQDSTPGAVESGAPAALSLKRTA